MSTAKRRRAAPGTAELRAVRRDELFDEAGNSDGDNSGSDGEEVAQVDAGLDNDDSDSADFDVDIDQLLDKEKLKALAKKELAGIARPPKRKRGSEQVEAHAAPEVAPIKESLSIIKRIKPSKSAEPAKSAPAVANGQPAASTPTEQSFADLGLSKWLTDTLAQLGIKTPSEIQKACIPPTLQGSDVIASAKTGSGKTAAFALPILQSLSRDPYGIYALVLTPTRELAFQIAEQFRALGAGMNLRQAVIVGGMDMMKQAAELARRPHVVVATPGRLVDHLTRAGSKIYLDRLKFLVLDEADRLLETTFAEDLETILANVPKSRQTLLFSATMTPEISEAQSHSQSSGKKLFTHHAADRYDTVDKLDQRFLIVPSAIRETYLYFLLSTECAGKSAIVFVSKSETCEKLRVMLRELGLASVALHAQMTQAERLSALAKFKSGVQKVLITTDVGARGLDVPEVEVVLNYDLAADATDYVHRVGRTARAGRGGRAIAMVTEHDVALLLNVEKKIGRKLSALEVAEKEVLDLLEKVSVAKRVAGLELMDRGFGKKKEVNEKKAKILRKEEKKQRKEVA